MSQLIDCSSPRLDPRLAIADVYLFRGRGSPGTAFVMCLNSSAEPFTLPALFCPNAHYDFRIDVNGDAVEEYTFRVVFGETDGGRSQPVELRILSGTNARDHHGTGDLMAWGSTDTRIDGANGVRLWAGGAENPQSVDTTVAEAVCRAVHAGSTLDLSSRHRRGASRSFVRTSISAIVLEVPDPFFRRLLEDNRNIRLWATTTFSTDAGGWRPINRMGLPLVRTIFYPPDDERAVEYNTTHPVEDRTNYGDFFAKLVARVVRAHGTAADPLAYGAAVVDLVLPDVLSYKVGSPANFGFAELNGRNLTDNAPEVMFSLVTNRAISVVLADRRSTGTPLPDFPYLCPQRQVRFSGTY